MLSTVLFSASRRQFARTGRVPAGSFASVSPLRRAFGLHLLNLSL